MHNPVTLTLHEVAIAAARLVPPEWTIKCAPSGPYPSDDPGNWHEFYSGIEGGELVVVVPCPDTPTALFIFLHEIGHVLLGHVFIPNKGLSSMLTELVETSASLWAYHYMTSHGLEVPMISKALARVMAKIAAEAVAIERVNG